MNKTELRQIIKEEVSKAMNEYVHGLGAFRRLIITSAKHEAIKSDIEKFMKRPEIKRDYPVKFTIKSSVMPNSFVIDMEGEGATALGNKLKDQAKKLDKSATVKVKTEAPKKAVKESLVPDFAVLADIGKMVAPTVLIAYSLAIMAGARPEGDKRSLIQVAKDWFSRIKTDNTISGIVSDLKDDPEVKEYLKNPKKKGWQDMLKKKVTPEELKYINRINRSMFASA